MTQYILQTCLLVRLNRILYDLHAKLRQYVFEIRENTISLIEGFTDETLATLVVSH